MTARMPQGFNDRLNHTIDLLRKAEPLALHYDPRGYYLAFSGGKDSQALYHAAELAGVKFEPHYTLTTIDPPELVRFIRQQYPDVINDRPKENFFQTILRKGTLPTQRVRYCCELLKETKGVGRVTLTGVRRQESARRAKRGEVLIFKKNKRGQDVTLDQFNRTQEQEPVQCVGGKDKIVINPIIEWSERDVWYFLNEVARVPHCELYDRGRTRIGCLFCPMTTTKAARRDEREYPGYFKLLMRTIHKMREQGYLSDTPLRDATDRDVFEWWISRKPIKHFIANTRMQQKIDFQ